MCWLVKIDPISTSFFRDWLSFTDFLALIYVISVEEQLCKSYFRTGSFKNRLRKSTSVPFGQRWPSRLPSLPCSRAGTDARGSVLIKQYFKVKSNTAGGAKSAGI